MSAHTPGPWRFDSDWGRLPTIFGADWKTKIAIVEKTSRNEHTTEQAANARLIAAAPDMLAAAIAQEKAEAFHLSCDACEGNEIPELCEACFPHYDDARLMRRAAIAKAAPSPSSAGSPSVSREGSASPSVIGHRGD